MLAASALSVFVALSALASSAPLHETAFEICLNRSATESADQLMGVDVTGVDGEWGWFPIGVTCEWRTEDSVWIQNPEWSTMVAVALPLVVTGFRVRSIRRRSRRLGLPKRGVRPSPRTATTGGGKRMGRFRKELANASSSG